MQGFSGSMFLWFRGEHGSSKETEVERELCYARTGRSSRREVSLSGIGSGFSALATCDANMW